MREQTITIFSKIIEWGVILLAFFLPLFFLPQTSGAFEFPKTLFLAFFVSVLGTVWLIKMILGRSVKILHGPLTMPILVFLGISFLSVIFSVHRFSSLYGSYPRFHDGIASLFVFVFLFFLVASNSKEDRQIARILAALCFSGFLVAVWGILNFFEIYLPGNFLRNSSLTPAGSALQAAFFLAAVFPFFYFAFLFSQQKTVRFFAAISGLVLLSYIFLISYFAATSAVLVTPLLGIVITRFQISKGMGVKIFVSLFIIVVLVLSHAEFVKSQIPFLKEKAPQREITLDVNTAWAIAASSFQNLKLLTLGSGPGTFIFDFTSFKPLGFNQTSLWNLRFEKSFNEYFQIISTLGVLGFLAFLWILLRFLNIGQASFKKIISGKNEGKYVALGVFSSLPVIAFIFFFTASFTLLSFTFWLVLGMAMALAGLRSVNEVKEVELSLAAIRVGGREVRGEALPVVVFTIVVFIIVPLLWQETALLRGEIQFTRAQTAQSQEEADANSILQSYARARDLVPGNDAYRRALSATALNFAVLGEQQKLVSEEVKQNLLKIAVVEGESAVRAAPHNILNWENLQSVYGSVTLQNQDNLLIDYAFQQEILLDPFNPRHRNDLGWAYFNLRNDIELAKRSFQDAISLKPDFADAHYSLARVYKEEGKKEKALQEYEQTLNLLNQQISQLESMAAARPDLQSISGQLKQFSAQIQGEKEELKAAIEKEKASLPAE